MPGRVREADGGILFLDEIGDMPLELQARLLRVLQEREVQPLGGGRAVAVDFDLVCSTNRDLGEMVEKGEFRSDLYYRIQDFTLRLPPLRERADRQKIIEVLLDQLGGSRYGLTLGEQAMQCMTRYHWPGNLRQLSSTLRTIIALANSGETIDVEHLPDDVRTQEATNIPGSCVERALQAQTHKAIEQALVDCNGSVSAAARQLGIHRSTIYRWLNRSTTH
jgi:transcriptional regulator of acetoin/glycerol metabolism